MAAEEVPIVMGIRQRSSEAAIKLILEPGEIGIDAAYRAVWVRDYDNNRWRIDAATNLKSFGAVGDGTTDDGNDIRSAVSALDSRGGGILFAPAGIYMMSSPVMVPSNVSIIGEFGATIFKSTPHTVWGSKGMFRYAGVSTCRMQDIILDGNIANQTLTGGGGGVDEGGSAGIEIGNGANKLTFSRVISRNHQGNTIGNFGDGLYIADAINGVAGDATPYDIKFTDCWFTGNYRQGCSIIGCKQTTFVNCTFEGTVGSNPGAGVDVEPDDSSSELINIIFDSCNFLSNEYGIVINNAQQAAIRGVIVTNCTMTNNRSSGVICGEHGKSGVPAGTRITGNNIRDNGGDGIGITGGSQCIEVLGNFIYGNSGYGIDVQPNSRWHKIVGNHILLNGKSGVRIDYAGVNGVCKHRIQGNFIYNNSTSSSGTYHGVEFVGDGTWPNQNSEVVGNSIGNLTALATATQQNGVHIPANCDGNIVKTNVFLGLLGAPVSNSGAANLIDDNTNGVTPIGRHANKALLYGNSDGAADSSGVYFDPANSRVGLGTSSPDVPFHQAASSRDSEYFAGEDVGANRLGGYIRWTRSVGADGGSYSGGITIAAHRLGSENRPICIGGRRIRFAADNTGTVSDHSTNVLLTLENRRLYHTGSSHQWAQGVAVASAGDLELGLDGNYYVVTGTTDINGIRTAGWQAGSLICLRIQSGLTISHDTTAGAGYAKIWLQSGLSWAAPANSMIFLIYDGTYWREACRVGKLAYSGTWDPGNMASDGDTVSTTVTVTGAVAGDICRATHDQIGANNVIISAHVQAADTVRVMLMNKTGGALDIASGTLRVVVERI